MLLAYIHRSTKEMHESKIVSKEYEIAARNEGETKTDPLKIIVGCMQDDTCMSLDRTSCQRKHAQHTNFVFFFHSNIFALNTHNTHYCTRFTSASISFLSALKQRNTHVHTRTLEGLDLEEAFHVLPPSGDVLLAGHKPVRVSGQRVGPCKNKKKQHQQQQQQQHERRYAKKQKSAKEKLTRVKTRRRPKPPKTSKTRKKKKKHRKHNNT